MRTSCFLAIFAVILGVSNRAAGQQRVVEYPVYDARTSAIPTITKIEMTGTSTRLYIHCTYVPGNWIEFSEKVFIQPDPDGEKLYARKMEGGAFHERITLPPSGDTSVVLIFPPLDEKVRRINYGTNDATFIYGLSLSQGGDNRMAGKTLPDSVREWMDAELAKAGVKTLTEYRSAEFFRNDTARLIGYLRGYHPRLGFSSGIIYAENVLTREDFPQVVTIHPDGRFEVDLPMNHPLYTYIAFNNKVSYFYIEPGQTLAMILNWDDFLKAGWGKRSSYRIRPIQFFGPAAQINSELAAIEIKRPSYEVLPEKARTMTPEKFREMHLTIWRANSDALEKELSSRELMPQTKTILRNELSLAHASYMYDYVQRREYEGRQDSTNTIVKVPCDSTFYDFLQKMTLNDQTLLISEDFRTFINRYEYGNAFKAAYTLAYLKKRGASEVERNLTRWELRDSILSSYYGLQPQLVQEISKTRSLKSTFQYPFKDKKDEARQFLTGLAEGISNPFLLKEAERFFRRTYPAQKQAAYQLPPGKATDIFNDIISAHKGKILFVDFWATSCAPCIAFIKSHKDERLKYRDNPDVDFIFITAADQSPEKTYQDFIEENEMDHTYRISADDFRYLKALFNFNGIPRYMLVGKDGSILNDDFPMFNFENEIRTRFPEYSAAGK